MEQVKANYDMMDSVLKDERVFSQVVESVFNKIDADKSGVVDIHEMKDYITKLCPSAAELTNAELNIMFGKEENSEDKSINKEAMGVFLRSMMEKERDKLEDMIKRGTTEPEEKYLKI